MKITNEAQDIIYGFILIIIVFIVTAWIGGIGQSYSNDEYYLDHQGTYRESSIF